jgi:hypothetical protein
MAANSLAMTQQGTCLNGVVVVVVVVIVVIVVVVVVFYCLCL